MRFLTLCVALLFAAGCAKKPAPNSPSTPSTPTDATTPSTPGTSTPQVPGKPLTTDAIAPTEATNGGNTVKGWLAWRGPHQTGVSDEKNLPDAWEIGGKNHLWTYDIAGRGSPVIADGKLYGIGYEGELADLQEVLFCLNAETGEKLWEKRRSDFLSDVVYDRYAIASPTVDPQTGYIYWLSTPGVLACYKPDGTEVWRSSLMENIGRNTYPNGRTGSVVIDADLLIVRGVTNNWGSEGPPNDRFYGMDKLTGEVVWSATPGVGPPFLKDSSVSTPFLDWVGDKRVFYSGTGDGNIVCINARDGTSIWRYQYCVGGIGSSVVVHDGGVIAIHGLEQPPLSPYGSTQGAITKLKIDAPTTKPEPGQPGAPYYGEDAKIWRGECVAFTSSPVLVGDRIYQCVDTGILLCIDAKTGKQLWSRKLAPDQIHASPVYGDGKLYLPFNNGLFYILKPNDEGPQELAKVQLDGNALGAPAIWNGKVYVHSMKKLYCFGEKREKDLSPAWPQRKAVKAGAAAKLQVIPADFQLHAGKAQTFRVRSLDANGHVVGLVTDSKVDYFIPPTARVKAQMDAKIEGDTIVAAKDSKMSAGSFKFTSGQLSGTTRGRLLAGLPYKEDFESFQITEKHDTETEADGSVSMFAYPPLAWLKARFAWEIRQVGDTKALAKTLDRLILQRQLTFIEDDVLSNYTLQADLMTDGGRRLASDVGLVNQRYQFALKGNHQQLEVTSNVERISESVPFKFDSKKWYTLKTRVDVNADGSGVIRAKAWPKGEPEPEAWTIEVQHKDAHKQGAPGLYGFAINGRYRVYIDNISITANGSSKE
ncbi:MAG: PQQ-binding-like beta-propeller repeat protein [Phycisphaeraceae bacterium]